MISLDQGELNHVEGQDCDVTVSVTDPEPGKRVPHSESLPAFCSQLP